MDIPNFLVLNIDQTPLSYVRLEKYTFKLSIELYDKQRYCPYFLPICDGSWSLWFLGEAILGAGIKTYFKL